MSSTSLNRVMFKRSDVIKRMKREKERGEKQKERREEKRHLAIITK